MQAGAAAGQGGQIWQRRAAPGGQPGTARPRPWEPATRRVRAAASTRKAASASATRTNISPSTMDGRLTGGEMEWGGERGRETGGGG
jgi:hypothetical protein